MDHKKIRGEIVEVLADRKNAKGTEHRSIFYELRDNPDLPESERSVERLQSEGMMLVMAGKASIHSITPRDASSNNVQSLHEPFLISSFSIK